LLALVQRLFGDPRREFQGPEGSADPGE